MTESDPNPQNPNPNDPQVQDLTFSYLCENPKQGFQVQDKGKEIITSLIPPFPPIERDFLQLKRESEGIEAEGLEKKVKIETLSLSLSLNTSVPMSASNLNDLRQSAVFLHNPSCSMSKENDQMWYAGEGTYGSVHSRFRPIGDGDTLTFANPKNEVNANNDEKKKINNSGNDSSFKTNGSYNIPLFLSESHVKTGNANVDRTLKGIVSKSVSFMAQILKGFSKESLEGLKDGLKSLMEATEKEKFVWLQGRLERRLDLSVETLSRANKAQLEILVAIKTGIIDFLLGKNQIPSSELIEIFLTTRCRNLNCKSLLPASYNCDCKFCTTQKGFCSACMCLICLKFDCASNTCSWVGCDFCTHWCHALCGLEKNIIRPGLNQKLGNGMTEMQFMCPGCDHASEMFGFVEEVFSCCSKNWGLEKLMKELDCVRMIFHVSEDFEGKELETKAKEMLTKLSKKQISPVDACNDILQFFKYGVSDHSVTGSSSKNILLRQPNLSGYLSDRILSTQTTSLVDTLPLTPLPTTVTPLKPSFNLTKSTTSILDTQFDALESERNLESKPKPLPLSIVSCFGLLLQRW